MPCKRDITDAKGGALLDRMETKEDSTQSRYSWCQFITRLAERYITDVHRLDAALDALGALYCKKHFILRVQLNIQQGYLAILS